ncbi:NAD(P)-binding protein [Thozetella sp. PMI_491]|nr:NAD(P)-binding protein [Thozetella sp. PMI_491]
MASSKVIIVTGASRGIGLAVTEYLVQNSHKAVLVARSREALQALKDKYPSQIEYLAADLTNFDAAAKVIELAVKTYGRLDGLIVNHGTLSPMKRIADATPEEWRQVYDANVFSALAFVKEAIPHLRESKGRIIFTSSGAASKGYSSWGAYGSSKAAMNSLAQHIAVEEPDIVAVSVAPGRVDTDMQKEVRELGAPGNLMTEKEHASFVEAFNDGKLNKPSWPGNVIARLSLDAGTELSGKFLSWNVPELAEYRDEH